MQLGCYTSPATTNCCGEPGSLGYEAVDMEFFASVGCDHVMVDWCRGYVDPKETRDEYAVIGEAIANSSNPKLVDCLFRAPFQPPMCRGRTMWQIWLERCGVECWLSSKQPAHPVDPATSASRVLQASLSRLVLVALT
jgi:hypothetical protein